MSKLNELYKGIFTKHTKEELKNSGIYAIVNNVNKKIYIGSTIRSFYRRWTEHRRILNKNEHPNMYLQNSWRKYGNESFEFRIIDTLSEFDKEEIHIIEQYHIDYNDSSCKENGYNLTTAYTHEDNDDSIPTSLRLKDKNIIEKNINYFCIPNEEDVRRIRDLHIIKGHNYEELMMIYNINYKVFINIIKGLSLEELKTKGLFDYDYKNREDIVILYERKENGMRDNCACCAFYDEYSDYCSYFIIELKNSEIFSCSKETHLNEVEIDTDIGYFKMEFGVDHVDKVTELYLGGKI